MHQSFSTINDPEFINLQPLDINPLMSACEIKVLYIGENRNKSYISKEVATEMAKTLRGAPIVGYYKKDKGDFADHGEIIVFDDEGIHFNCMTKPYGFVSPDADVWFQDFQDFDDFGNSIVRTYLMTIGYLWTGQFEQAQQVLKDGGKPHSMELDEKSLQGKWSTNIKENIEFFIINDAVFSKLCILGDDVEPCFQGSSIKPLENNNNFTLNNNFKQTLFEMMKDLSYALKGGNTVAEEKNVQVQDKINETSFTENEENKKEEVDFTVAEGKEDNDKFAVKEEEKEDSKEEEEESEENNNDDNDNDDEEDEKKKSYSLLEQELKTLQSNYNALEEEVKSLREFKQNIESKEKDELINQFYMLSEEDKKDVIENKDKYSFDEIESKLAVICFKKKVNFNLDELSKNENIQKDEPIVTFNVTNTQDSTPDWIKEVELTMKNY